MGAPKGRTRSTSARPVGSVKAAATDGGKDLRALQAPLAADFAALEAQMLLLGQETGSPSERAT